MVLGATDLDDQGQELAYNARERRRGHVDPGLGLFLTHRFRASDSGFDVGDAFPDRNRPITFAVDVRRNDTGARGIVFEAGNDTTGLAIWIPSGGTDVSACAGNSGENGVTVTAENVLATDGQIARVVFSVIPGSGQARIWTNGELRGRGVSDAGVLPSGWAADSLGGIGEVQGSVSPRVPAGDRITLVNASIVSSVSVFRGQRPRQFNDAVVGVPS